MMRRIPRPATRYNWIGVFDAYPSGKNWELYDEQLCEVFCELFGER